MIAENQVYKQIVVALSKNKFTAEQKRLIATCQWTGYGWAKFASSVEAQGYCSELQHKKLIEMVEIIERKNSLHRQKRHGGDYGGGLGCTDSEIMSFGEYV
jgi:hypothetical protein